MSDEWRSVAAASVARIEIGGTPAREQPTFWSDQDGGHAWASIADLHSRDVVETAEYISDLGVRSSNVKLVSAGTPIMSFKLTIGRTALAGRDLYTNEAIAAFFGDPTQVDRRFLFHTLPGSARSVITDVAIKGATLNKKSLSSMKLLLPSIEEQRRIADVLDSLDDQIQATKQIIGKYVAQEHGLVDDIVSHAVHRAVDGDQACVFAHLGSIVQEHGGVMQTGPFGSQLHAYDYVGEGVPVVMPQDIVDGPDRFGFNRAGPGAFGS